MTIRINATFSDDTAGLLEKVGNRSEYLDRIVRDRWQRWQDALMQLKSAGWSTAEALAACDALNGLWVDASSRTPQGIALELSDAASLNGLCEKWELNAQAWSKRVKQLSTNWQHTLALLDVSSEFWSGNQACEQAIRRLGDG